MICYGSMLIWSFNMSINKVKMNFFAMREIYKYNAHAQTANVV